MRKALLGTVCGLVVVACGGGGGGPSFKDPDSVQFTYGTSAPAAGSTLDAAIAAENGASDALALTDAASDARTQSLTSLPDNMAAAVFADTTPFAIEAKMSRARAAMSKRAAAYAAGDVAAAVAGFDNPACITVTLTEVRYNHCTQTETDTDGTITISANGYLLRNLTDVEWDLALNANMTVYDPGGNLHMQLGSHMTGQIGVTETAYDLWTVKGSARSDNSAKLSAQGQSLSLAFTHNVDLDIDYQPSTATAVSGTVELKRIWTERPAGFTAADLPDLGVLIQWDGASINVSLASNP